MTWAHPFFLISLVAVAIPIFLHLFGKKPAQTVKLPTIEILRRAMDARRKRSRIREMLLLLFRCFFLIFLIFAIARPFLKRPGTTPASTSQKLVLIIDNSLSMGTVLGGQSLFRKAIDEASRIVKGVRPHDTCLIRPLIATGIELSTPTDDTARLQKILHDIPLTFQGGSLFPALYSALTSFPKDSTPEVYFITDGTKEAWNERSQENQKLQLTVLDVSKGAPRPNATILDVKASISNADIGKTSLVARIRPQDFHRGPIVVELEIYKADRWNILDRKFVDADKTQDVSFDYAKGNEGAVARVRLGPDALETDNFFYVPLKGQGRQAVLIANGNPQTNPREDSAFFIRSALSPTYDVAETAMEQLSSSVLSRFSIVFLVDGGTLSTDVSTSIKSFVEKGGTLVVGAGETFNQTQFSPQIQELVPSPLRVIRSSENEQGLPLDPPSGIFEFLRNEWSQSLSRARVQKWVVTEPAPDSQALLKVSSGYPILLAKKQGKGSLLFWATSFNSSWSNLPLNSSFPALMRRLVLHAAEQQTPPLTIEKIKVGDRSYLKKVSSVDGGTEDFPERPGLWKKMDAKEDEFLETEPDRKEFNLDRVDPKALAAAVMPIEIAWNDERRSAPVRPGGPSFETQETLLFAILALIALILESILSGKLPRFIFRRLLSRTLIVCLIFTSQVKSSWAAEQNSAVSVGSLLFKSKPPSPYSKPLLPLLSKARELANLDLTMDLVPVSATSPQLYDHPLLYMGGDRVFSATPEEINVLRHHLSIGGMVFFDDAIGGNQSEFFLSVQKLAVQLFPSKKFEPIDREHPIFRSFYLLEGPWGRRTDGKLSGIHVERRTAIFYFSGDLAGAFESSSNQTEQVMATRFGTNLLMYALTLDYKADQIHLPFILQRRQ